MIRDVVVDSGVPLVVSMLSSDVGDPYSKSSPSSSSEVIITISRDADADVPVAGPDVLSGWDEFYIGDTPQEIIQPR